jgi:hypothetical protein
MRIREMDVDERFMSRQILHSNCSVRSEKSNVDKQPGREKQPITYSYSLSQPRYLT